MLGQYDAGAAIAVKDIEEAKKFYSDVLGLSLENESPGGVSYKSGNTTIFVYPSEYAGTNKATCAGWVVPDVSSMVEELKSKGVTFEQYDLPGVTREGDVHVMGELKAAWFKDPSGNILSFSNTMG
jgi:catechol 2,3-dioxygenase-like lactoylglutathione lyase family enzyme